MSADKIRVDLCGDHFERLVTQDPCTTCPSLAENEAVCKAMAAVMAADDTSAKDSAVISELKSIRRTQGDIAHRLGKLERRFEDNGKPGVMSRLTLLEARQKDSKQNMGILIALAGVASSWIALLAMFFTG